MSDARPVALSQDLGKYREAQSRLVFDHELVGEYLDTFTNGPIQSPPLVDKELSKFPAIFNDINTSLTLIWGKDPAFLAKESSEDIWFSRFKKAVEGGEESLRAYLGSRQNNTELKILLETLMDKIVGIVEQIDDSAAEEIRKIRESEKKKDPTKTSNTFTPSNSSSGQTGDQSDANAQTSRQEAVEDVREQLKDYVSVLAHAQTLLETNKEEQNELQTTYNGDLDVYLQSKYGGSLRRDPRLLRKLQGLSANFLALDTLATNLAPKKPPSPQQKPASKASSPVGSQIPGGGNLLQASPARSNEQQSGKSSTTNQFSSGNKVKANIEEVVKVTHDAKRLKRVLGEITSSISDVKLQERIRQDFNGDLDSFLRSKYGSDFGVQVLNKNRHISSELLTLTTTFDSYIKTDTTKPSNQRASVATLREVLQDPILSTNIDNIAYGYGLLELSKNNGVDILSQAKYKIPEIAEYIQRNPGLEKEFDQYFTKKVAAYRLEYFAQRGQDGSAFVFKDLIDPADPDFAKLSPKEKQQLRQIAASSRTEFIDAIANLKKSGVDVSLYLNASTEELLAHIEQKKLSISQFQEIAPPLSVEQQRELAGLEQDHQSLLLTLKAKVEIAPQIVVVSPSDNGAIGSYYGLESYSLGEEGLQQQEQIIYSSGESAQMLMEDLANDYIPPSTYDDVSIGSSGRGSFLSRLRRSEKPLLKKANAQKKKLQALKKSAEVLAKLAANPAAIGVVLGLGGLGLGVASLMSNLTLGAFTGFGGTIGGVIGLLGGPIGVGAGITLGSTIGNVMGNWYLTGTPQLGFGNAGFGNFVSTAQATAQNVGLPTTEAVNTALQTGASNAATTGSSFSKLGARLAGDVASKSLNGASKLLSGLQNIPATFSSVGPATTLVAAPLGGVAVITLISVSSMVGSFLIPDEAFTGGNEHIEISKTATPNFAEDPTTVTYTITIKPKEPYTVTITQATDQMSFQSAGDPPPDVQVGQDVLNQLNGELAPEGKTISYQINFTEAYDDTRITNTLTVRYTATSAEEGAQAESSSFSTSATVAFGNPPAIGGCWPVSGVIKQLPFESGGSHAALRADAYDIAAPMGTPIKAPYSGTVIQKPYTIQGGSSAGIRWNGAGNFVILRSDIGYDFTFQHLLSFEGSDGPVEAGAIIGYVDNTGNSSGPHLHYEVRRTWNVSNTNTTSVLATMVPADENGKSPVELESRVSADRCVAGSGESNEPTEVDRIGCYSFQRGTKNWTTQEIALVKNTLSQEILSDPKRKDAVCTVGGVETTIILSRVGGDASLYQDAGGSWSAYVSSANEIEINDNMFPGDVAEYNQGVFGRSSILHEQGHIISFRHLSEVESNYPRSIYSSLSSILPTYPYNINAGNPDSSPTVLANKYYLESFAEAFGMCTARTVRPDLPFRGQGISVLQYQSHCDAVQNTLNSISP